MQKRLPEWSAIEDLKKNFPKLPWEDEEECTIDDEQSNKENDKAIRIPREKCSVSKYKIG